jgi:tetratricopeptide (TPR) repeat protein
LEGLPDVSLWTTENIRFIENFADIIHTHDKIFHRCIEHAASIDSIMGKGDAQHLITSVVYKDVVKPNVDIGLKDSVEPNWEAIGKAIQVTYGDYYAERCVVGGRVKYYKTRKEWESYAKYFVRLMEIVQISDWNSIVSLDNNAFEVFKYSKNSKELEEALTWINKALSLETSSPHAAVIDTKANLLYKLGRKEEALPLEKQAHNLAPNDKDIEDNYVKMKSGLPTWPLN